MPTLTSMAQRPDAVLSGPVRSADGRLLLGPNTRLTPRQVELRRRRDALVFVSDAGAAREPHADVVDPVVRGHVMARLSQVHDALASPVAMLRTLGPSAALARLREDRLRDAVSGALCLDVDRALRAAAEELLGSTIHVRANGPRAHDASPLVHAVDTTAIAVALGRHLHLDRARLGELARGCLLHDLGMLLLPSDLRARGRLGPAERAAARLHPRLGYELLRRIRPGAVIANHVAYQHHERQDGTGYPRGLRGLNRVGRLSCREGASSAGRIILEAEIVAAADVYVALTARRPHRAPFRPGQVVALLHRLAGRQLNREVVGALIDLIGGHPPAPAARAAATR